MKLWICFFIFGAKVMETSLGTFRLIVVANGKKWLGAFLSGIISIVWVISTGMVVTNFNKYPLRIIFLALGCFVGSYLGSFIEEKMAMGNNMMVAITNDNFGSIICTHLRIHGYAVTMTKGRGMDNIKNILFIMVPRKKRIEVCSIIEKIDENAMILTYNANMIHGGFFT